MGKLIKSTKAGRGSFSTKYLDLRTIVTVSSMTPFIVFVVSSMSSRSSFFVRYQTNMACSTWGIEKTASFIEDYRNSPELWDNRCFEYKDQVLRIDKLKDLALKYNCTVSEVKKKIKNLRSAFHRERKKLRRKNGTSSGQSGKWFGFELLSFLADIETYRSYGDSEEEMYEEEEQEATTDSPFVQPEPNPCSKPSEETNKQSNGSEEAQACNLLWSNEKTALFIEDFRNAPELWDIKSNEYKDQIKRIDKLRELALKYNCTLPELKKKIKNLRSSFHRERKRLLRKNGSSATQSCRWFGFELLSFLSDIDTNRSNAYSDEEVYEEEEQESTITTDSSFLQPELTMCIKPPEMTNIKRTDSCEEERENRDPPKKKRKKKGALCSGRDDEAFSILKNYSRRDECSTYGEHVGNELRNLCPRTRTIVKHLINNTLFEAAMGKYDHGVVPNVVADPLCGIIASSANENVPTHNAQQ